ncbi:MAG TPA: 3-isopropylmalate dehydratase large subunit, partial [Anaerolineae bacterium]|nr:3-isopropylmalate dehydratase large subunit [Anaerolineae bacterium]
MSQNGHPKTLFEKIWDNHVVVDEEDSPSVLYIDLHLVHEVTSPQAFTGLREKGLKVRRPDKTIATMDHGIPTTSPEIPISDVLVLKQISQLEKNCNDFGIPLHGLYSPNRGIVHVIGPELGLTQPGMTIVCGDSHTSTHGAFGALAFGIGTSEIEHVLATQCLLQVKPKTYAVKVEGQLPKGVSSKDIILNLISRIGIGGGTGHVFEYMGEAIRSLSMEERMTICNMSIEGGARAGMVGPDDTTFEYIAGRPHAPQGEAWEAAVEEWRTLPTDEGATFDKEIVIDANKLEPMITYGTNPGMGMLITQPVPDPMQFGTVSERQTLEKALNYMDLQPGQIVMLEPGEQVQ